jgi:hypothetical protein
MLPCHQPPDAMCAQHSSCKARDLPVPMLIPEKCEEYIALLDQALRGSVNSLEDGEMSQ